MTQPSPVVIKRALLALGVIGVFAFLVYGLYLAARPVAAPLQGQIDARYIDVSPKIIGRVAEVHVREGDDVDAEDLLVTLNSPEVEAKLSQAVAARDGIVAKQTLLDHGVRKEEMRVAQANWEHAVTSATLAESTFKRINSLYIDGLVSQQRYDEVNTAYRSAVDGVNAARATYDLTLNGFRSEERTAAADATRAANAAVDEVGALAADIFLKSPLRGEVDKVVLHQGELATPGFPIVSLVNLDDVWAVFNLREDELAKIKIDTVINGKVPALGDRAVAFSVYYISPRGEYATWRATRQSSGYDIKTFEVRARPTEKVDGLRPGMSVLVDRR
jgi:HlyD family secretion protein